MGRLRQKGKAGAAKAYVTRSAAIKRLQCSLADFRRLCIIKGIFPREPRHRKRANKGSSAPASFYYAKDIAYLAHEPILKKLREHKAFAKKLARALGRGEWSSAKSLEDNKPVYRLDHIIKERYPSFIDAIRDIDDALCMIFLFASLPSNDRISTSLVENCSRLAAEWQLYVMRTRSLRKVFLSIKGVYYQAEVMDQPITWLVPYQFTQNIPSDVDVRVMLTFLELYQTLLGFVFFKLYTEIDLVYPPPLDLDKQDSGAGIGAFALEERNRDDMLSSVLSASTGQSNGKRVSSKAVRQAIKALAESSVTAEELENDVPSRDAESEHQDEMFVLRPSASNPGDAADLSTLHSFSSFPQSHVTNLFEPYTFFLSRETSRPIFEFIVRCFGGRIGWSSTTGSGSPYDETDDSITHVILDRPLNQRSDATGAELNRMRRRKYVQPQWIVDCINSGRLLLEEPYSQGKTLPPHLSPFSGREGAQELRAGITGDSAMDDMMEKNETSEEDEPDGDKSDSERSADKALMATMEASHSDPGAMRGVELQAEAVGVDYGTFEKKLAKTQKKGTKVGEGVNGVEDMNKMMLSNKQRKLYEKVRYSERKRQAENAKLEERRKELRKVQKRERKPT
ncbi:Pescadillo N-terminus-domain-containing protein [Multifurca ochricompacta]|uniref:Pescadillo homolog n=1 Tax=Multifurca ochricompacta TaxID=376703 RepID=A0AAD4MCJ9_9AGAM|nr:Pescadillo N-terminus-domain-containing protein [Multifurca ochricompacta]